MSALLSTPRSFPVSTVLEAFLESATGVAKDDGLPKSWCIAAAALAREVLPRFGVRRVRVVGVDIVAYNQPAYASVAAGIEPEDWPALACAVTLNGTDRAAEIGWDGHVVAYVPDRAGGPWLVDGAVLPAGARPSCVAMSGGDSGFVPTRGAAAAADAGRRDGQRPSQPRLRNFRQAPAGYYSCIAPLALEIDVP